MAGNLQHGELWGPVHAKGGEGLGRICSVKSVSGFRITVAVGKFENFSPEWSALSTVG